MRYRRRSKTSHPNNLVLCVKPEVGLSNKGSCFAAALGTTEFLAIIAIFCCDAQVRCSGLLYLPPLCLFKRNACTIAITFPPVHTHCLPVCQTAYVHACLCTCLYAMPACVSACLCQFSFILFFPLLNPLKWGSSQTSRQTVR